MPGQCSHEQDQIREQRLAEEVPKIRRLLPLPVGRYRMGWKGDPTVLADL